MKVVGADLCLDGVSRASTAQARVGRSSLALGVASLHHELSDHAVENQAVVEAVLHKFEKVVSVLRCGIAELHHHGAKARVNLHHRWAFRST